MTDEQQQQSARVEQMWDEQLCQWLVRYEQEEYPDDPRDMAEVDDAVELWEWDVATGSMLLERLEPDASTFAVVRMITLARYATEECLHSEERFVELARAAHRAVQSAREQREKKQPEESNDER